MKKRKHVNYELLYQKLKEKPLTFTEIKELTGIKNKSAMQQVITTLSIKYPIWQPKTGVYKLCEPSDYKTVNWEKLEE